MTEPAPSAHQALRAATADKHEAVDATFARYDLADAGDYAAFLTAHARVLPAVEHALADVEALPSFAPRTPQLAADLSALDRLMPAPDMVSPPASDAAAWGMLYVIEGSRLGGAFLARAVPDPLPKAYLSAAHERGGWRQLLQSLDAAAANGGGMWVHDAIAAARATFDLYAAAANRP